MRKILSLALFAAIVVSSVTSCKSKQSCPAYGKISAPATKVKSV